MFPPIFLQLRERLVDLIGIEEIGRALSPSQPLGAKLPLDVGIGETCDECWSKSQNGQRRHQDIRNPNTAIIFFLKMTYVSSMICYKCDIIRDITTRVVRKLLYQRENDYESASVKHNADNVSD